MHPHSTAREICCATAEELPGSPKFTICQPFKRQISPTDLGDRHAMFRMESKCTWTAGFAIVFGRNKALSGKCRLNEKVS
jgi:hypothetical protein